MKRAKMRSQKSTALTDPGSKSTGTAKEHGVFCAGILLVLLVLSRYLVNGEPVDVRSEIMETDNGFAEETIDLFDGVEMVQSLTIPEGANWRQGYYALCFIPRNVDSKGTVVCTLKQGGRQETCRMAVKELVVGTWTPLKDLDFGELESGAAVLSIHTEDVKAGELEAAVCQDHYGFGNLQQNGEELQVALAQAYHYHLTGTEYKIRFLCYGITVLCAGILIWLVCSERIGKNRRNLAAFAVLTIMFMNMIYLIDSSIYLEPTYAEAVTNFLHNAREEKFAANLLITDAGYLPLLPRLITLFYLKVLRLPSAYALYFMQGTACFLCSIVWSFFVLQPFEGWMRFPNRILWCLLVMLTCFCEETLFFTNHAYWGIYLLLLLLIADLRRFPGWIYGCLLCVSALICLSKGTYVVMLPLMVLYLLFFGKSIGERDRLFAYVTGGASFLQLLYSFSGRGDGGGWIDMEVMGQIGYWFRLPVRALVEFSASLLTPIGETVQSISWLIVGMAAVVGIGLVAGFVGHVLPSRIRGERIDRRRAIFYTMVLFQLIISVFFLMTVKSVPDAWKDMGRIIYAPMGDKYEIFFNMGCYMLWLTGGTFVIHLAMQREGVRIALFCSRYGVMVLLIIFCLTNPTMHLTGWSDAQVSDRRVYAGNINASWRDCKDLISESSFFLPVRGDNWAYSRNCNLYQVGAEGYFEETSCINLEETVSGYHCTYEVQDAAQAQNVIEVMIERPLRVDEISYQVQLLDAESKIIAEAKQMDSGRNRKCIFRFSEPVNGVKTIRLTDDMGNPAYYKDYIAWASAW